MEKMVFQLAVIDGPIVVRQELETGDLVIEFESTHRAAANKRFQVRLKPDAADQLSSALQAALPIHR
ncbi:hypothetical protein [Pseudomonas inefficax]|uniref:hypothetical protein n=1 Tax=Pseudomonas inefficax TaxID=2078786 RepID=UPI004046FC8F